MIVARFGDTWQNAYRLGLLEAEETDEVQRSPTLQEVGGAHGAFDFSAASPWPLKPKEINRTFSVASETFQGIDKAVEELKGALLGVGRSKVWGVLRDGSTRRWAWGKCASLSTRETRGQYFSKSVTARFLMPEGVWYGETQNVIAQTSAYAAVGDTQWSVQYRGNLPAPYKATFSRVNSTHSTDQIIFQNLTNLNYWSFNPASSNVGTVHVDSGAFSVIYYAPDDELSPINAYTSLTLGTPPNTSGPLWHWLVPGNNDLRVQWVTASGTSDMVVTLTWYDLFL
jgi:hypothetical protein